MVEFDIEKNIAIIGKQMVVFHCNHYNLTLQRTIIDAIGEKGITIQINAAMRSTQQMLSNIDGDIKQFAIDNFSKLGFGVLDCSSLNEDGGIVKVPFSHYAIAWFEKFGPCKEAVCHFNAGYILGIINSLYGKNLNHTNIKETACRAMDPERIESCEFEVKL